jgi:hypothetical protein
MAITDPSFFDFRACFLDESNLSERYNDVDLSMLSRKERRERREMRWMKWRNDSIGVPGIVFHTEQVSKDATVRGNRAACSLKPTIDLLTGDGCVCDVCRPITEKAGQDIAALVLNDGMNCVQ